MNAVEEFTFGRSDLRCRREVFQNLPPGGIFGGAAAAAVVDGSQIEKVARFRKSFWRSSGQVTACHCLSAVVLVVAGGGFEPPDLWVLRSDSPFDESRTVPSSTGMLAIQSLRVSLTIPRAWFGIAFALARRRFHRL